MGVETLFTPPAVRQLVCSLFRYMTISPVNMTSFIWKSDSARMARFRACLLGGAVGDALGAPVEFEFHRTILRNFGEGGIRDFIEVYDLPAGAITDDTQMALFTAEGLLESLAAGDGATLHEPGKFLSMAYQRWLWTQGYSQPLQRGLLTGGLLTHQALFASRAPGNTCLRGLMAMEALGQHATNHSKGCGGVMRVAPVGMLFASLHASHGRDKETALREAFEVGCASAALTHGHVTGQYASGAFAALLFLVLTGTSLAQSVPPVLDLLAACSDNEETRDIINRAVQLACMGPPCHARLSQLGEGWIGEEALAIGLYAALSATDFESGVVLAVNHDGDSDSTGLIAGHLLGAMHGFSAIPERWRASLELRTVLEEMADRLVLCGHYASEGSTGPQAA